MKVPLYRIILIGFALIILCGFLFQVAAAQYYTIPVMALSNSPLDNLKNYFSNRPIVPTTIAGNNKGFIPQDGIIERIEIFDYSTTASSNEAWGYYIQINTTQRYLIQNITVSGKQHIFTNSSSTLKIPVYAGNYFEIFRQNPTWGTNPVANTVGGYIFVCATVHGYAIPMEALTSSPADSAQNYMGFRPIVPTVQGASKYYVPAAGNITSVFIYDNSSGAQPGTAEVVSYYVQVNGGNQKFISNRLWGNNTLEGSYAVGPERTFVNTNLNLNINRGDYVEFKRDNPVWVVNPLLNIVSGSAWVNTEISGDPQGYQLQIQALTSDPVDAQVVYIGNKPSAPELTSGINKIYVPKAGTINRAELYVYSGTAGTNNDWKIYVNVTTATGLAKSLSLINTVNASANERLFKNATMGISVDAGDYIEIKGVQPTWPTNPLTTIYGGYLYVEEAMAGCPADIILPPVAQFSVNLTPGPEGMTAQFFSQANNTIPGSTKYSWNFTGYGTGAKEDSDLENPVFVYTTAGTYTVRFSVALPGPVIDTMTKTDYIRIYVPEAEPTPCPEDTPCPGGGDGSSGSCTGTITGQAESVQDYMEFAPVLFIVGVAVGILVVNKMRKRQ